VATDVPVTRVHLWSQITRNPTLLHPRCRARRLRRRPRRVPVCPGRVVHRNRRRAKSRVSTARSAPSSACPTSREEDT